MKDDEKKFFDVDKNRVARPSPTSRPVIVGHQPTVPDPMIRESAAKTAQPTVVEAAQNADAMPAQEKAPQISDIAAPHQNEPSLSPESNIEPANANILPGAAHAPGETVIPGPLEVPGPADTVSQAPAELPDYSDLPPTAKIPDQPVPADEGQQLHVPAGHGTVHHQPRLWVWIIAGILVLIGIYAAIDAKFSFLPFHIFSHDNTPAAVDNEQTRSSPANSTPQPTPSNGLSKYQPSGTQFTLSYPTTWGSPATTADAGFSQRGDGKKSDGTHAYIVTFSKNKEVEVALTSSKFLPADRKATYYDYLQWCMGTNDSKYYQSVLKFSSSGGVDTPSTITCDQGPLDSVSKINDVSIVQAKQKNSAGTVIGDIYAANLSNTGLPVMHIKDATMKNGTEIEKMLAALSSQSQ